MSILHCDLYNYTDQTAGSVPSLFSCGDLVWESSTPKLAPKKNLVNLNKKFPIFWISKTAQHFE